MKISISWYIFNILLVSSATIPYDYDVHFSINPFDTITHTTIHAKQDQIPHARTSKIKNIVFDLDGVLCQTNKLQAFYEIGIPATLQLIYDLQTFPCEKMVFDTLADVPALSTAKSYNKGLLLPCIMIDWQTNAQSLDAIQKSVKRYLDKAPFHPSQKNWVLQSIRMMTTPEQFIKTRQLILDNVQLVHELKSQGYRVYILSNWDKDSFPLFQDQFPKLFEHNTHQTFDGIMISGDVGTLKPASKIFHQCLEQFNLNPTTTLFIDDEPANIAGAANVNIHTLLSNPTDTDNLRKNILNVLK